MHITKKTILRIFTKCTICFQGSEKDRSSLNEPSLGLAPLIVKELFEIIKTLNKRGLSILLVEQNALNALAISDYAYVLENGEKVLEGPSKKLISDEKIKKAYLGM